MVKICVDAGHGGKDPGACGNGRQEKDYTLKLALGLGSQLQQHGINVIYTRTDDRFLELYERADISNNNSCDYFISQHVNSGGGYGLETFAYLTSNKGKEFAKAIQNSMVANRVATRDRGVKTANFAVLRKTKCPAILIENHFIDNAADMEFLDANLKKIIELQAKAILDFIGISSSIRVHESQSTPVPQPKLYCDFASLQREFVNQDFGNISVDNIPGPRTVAAAPTVRQGARGNITKWIQERLIYLGYNVAYGADGIFGEGTRQAVMEFQRNNGLVTDGIVGKNTWRKLLGL
ncbi:N-acetylmuramoyl-L-alanine amidase [Clostridium amylolyticum]|uniref:N-acetylmuramoyl-L-alanine amidase n=1 Tax=Clostridium amylolyticum TaxID=1121298 RepID=A0A1M6EUN4_9CLOT|nr:N-acetylmuramoyl-L-alanine amidase [Clostridium amylolyticum]SHI89123.1 N-acetylmuramoyl-L-alanine amidase [Clostridium amylolyticum]